MRGPRAGTRPAAFSPDKARPGRSRTARAIPRSGVRPRSETAERIYGPYACHCSGARPMAAAGDRPPAACRVGSPGSALVLPRCPRPSPWGAQRRSPDTRNASAPPRRVIPQRGDMPPRTARAGRPTTSSQRVLKTSADLALDESILGYRVAGGEEHARHDRVIAHRCRKSVDDMREHAGCVDVDQARVAVGSGSSTTWRPGSPPPSCGPASMAPGTPCPGCHLRSRHGGRRARTAGDASRQRSSTCRRQTVRRSAGGAIAACSQRTHLPR